MLIDKWNKHPCKKVFDALMKMLGIDMTIWYYSDGDDVSHSDWITVCYGNEKVEDITMIVEFGERKGTWVLENFEMNLD